MIRNVPSTGMSFDEAMNIVKRIGRGDVLIGLDSIVALWDDYARNGDDRYEWDSDFIEDYIWEFDAYNIVFQNMSKLFARKAA